MLRPEARPELAPDSLLAFQDVVPWKDSPGVNPTDRVGGIALYSQGTVDNYINSETERMASLKIRL